MKLMLGADPEVFLSLGGKWVSAHGLFPGTKENPHPVDKGAIQVDGLALEFNIHPAETPEEFSSNIETVLNQMKEMVSKVDKDMKINFTPYAEFDVKYFKEEIPDAAKILGCDPDYSCLNGHVIDKVEDLTDIPIRTAAGHIHVGWTENEDPFDAVHFEDARYIANYFYGAGASATKRYGNLSRDEQNRLRYYGSLGAFRPKSYGVELRQFSNVWVSKPETQMQAFNYVKNTVNSLSKN